MRNFIFIAALATLASGRAISRAQDAPSTSTDDPLKLESKSADKHDPLYGAFIHYPVLHPNNVPCDQRSGMKGNCKPGPPDNPYHRGCNAITRCRVYGAGSKGKTKGTKKEGEETEEDREGSHKSG
ncbi:unnamed protein product [Cercospora beticola]|nr:unnamed protein product [Cercospora beticola]